ncbi:MAG TPA: alpha/beta fold hydrolase, partial [Candidatus Limiplasma sp.]|nr:alpha/beta fold hydrolase [Candidatus Limiplasma sp.]
MRPLGDALHALGYTVMGINLPGHATTENNMAKTGYHEWIEAVQNAAQNLKKDCRTVTACGLSMGGVLALLLAEQHRVDACVTISAPMPSANVILPLAWMIWPFVPRVEWNTDDARAAQLNQTYDVGYSGFSSRKGVDLQHLIRLAHKSLNQIICPTLAVQSTEDTAVNQNSAQNILRGISSTQKKELILHGVPHVCTISDQLPLIVDAIDETMKTLPVGMIAFAPVVGSQVQLVGFGPAMAGVTLLSIPSLL